MTLRTALASLACCLPLAFTGCIAYGPCGPVYIWDLFGKSPASPTSPTMAANPTAQLTLGGTNSAAVAAPSQQVTTP
jgi:hypothetical protein